MHTKSTETVVYWCPVPRKLGVPYWFKYERYTTLYNTKCSSTETVKVSCSCKTSKIAFHCVSCVSCSQMQTNVVGVITWCMLGYYYKILFYEVLLSDKTLLCLSINYSFVCPPAQTFPATVGFWLVDLSHPSLTKQVNTSSPRLIWPRGSLMSLNRTNMQMFS